MAVVGAIAVPHPPLIVEAVGRGEQRRIQATIDAYRQATRNLLNQHPDCLVVTSPHAPLFRDGFHVTTDADLSGNMARFSAPDERLHARTDVPLAKEIVRHATAAGIVAVGSERYRDGMDHGAYVPLYFVREVVRVVGERPAAADLPVPIVHNGIAACSRDSRFSPVSPDELDFLEYSVDVLGEPEPIASPAELDPLRFGVIVRKGARRGLLLPDLEGVDAPDVQLRIAKQKAGIHPADEDVALERFEVVRHTRGGEPRAQAGVHSV